MTKTICIFCLSLDPCPDSEEPLNRIPLDEFIREVDWTKLEAEKIHLEKAQSHSELSEYCRTKIIRINDLLTNYKP